MAGFNCGKYALGIICEAQREVNEVTAPMFCVV